LNQFYGSKCFEPPPPPFLQGKMKNVLLVLVLLETKINNMAGIRYFFVVAGEIAYYVNFIKSYWKEFIQIEYKKRNWNTSVHTQKKYKQTLDVDFKKHHRTVDIRFFLAMINHACKVSAWIARSVF
jgi:hypothetical protein